MFPIRIIPQYHQYLQWQFKHSVTVYRNGVKSYSLQPSSNTEQTGDPEKHTRKKIYRRYPRFTLHSAGNCSTYAQIRSHAIHSQQQYSNVPTQYFLVSIWLRHTFFSPRTDECHQSGLFRPGRCLNHFQKIIS